METRLQILERRFELEPDNHQLGRWVERLKFLACQDDAEYTYWTFYWGSAKYLSCVTNSLELTHETMAWRRKSFDYPTREWIAAFCPLDPTLWWVFKRPRSWGLRRIYRVNREGFIELVKLVPMLDRWNCEHFTDEERRDLNHQMEADCSGHNKVPACWHCESSWEKAGRKVPRNRPLLYVYIPPELDRKNLGLASSTRLNHGITCDCLMCKQDNEKFNKMGIVFQWK